ncbi:MAG TPA: hypothetical protein VGK41_07595 [Solirubrobacterales bacterium]
MSATVRNRSGLIAELTRAGHLSAADNVRHMCHPGNTAATLEEIADWHGGAEVDDDGAAGIIRRAIQAAEDAEQMHRDDAINEQASRAKQAIRDAAAAGAEPDQLDRMAQRLEDMGGRVDSESGLDAEDVLTWQLRQMLLSDSHHVADLEQLTRDHLAARDRCVVCSGTGRSEGAVPGSVAGSCNVCGGAGTVKRYPHQLGDRIRDYVEQEAGLGGLVPATGEGGGRMVGVTDDQADLAEHELPEPAAVLVTTALDWVHWGELAAEQIANAEANG